MLIGKLSLILENYINGLGGGGGGGGGGGVGDDPTNLPLQALLKTLYYHLSRVRNFIFTRCLNHVALWREA